MDRKWIYKDDSGAEYGPYTREELVLYAQQNRIDANGEIREQGGEWIRASELLSIDGAGEAGVPVTSPPTERSQAERIARQDHADSISTFPRIGYILLGTILPLTACGLAGVNNLLVGRTAIGAVQLGLSLFGVVLNFVGLIIGVTFCIGVPIWLGVLLWSILEAATNQYDGRGRMMK